MTEYLTSRYMSSAPERVLFLIKHFPLATLIPEHGPGDDLTYLPLVQQRDADEHVALVGHIDNMNPFIRHLDGHRIRAVFHGPNAYISPRDYVFAQLPTWNYAVAHVTGMSSLIEQESQKLDYLAQIIDQLETANGTDYRLDESGRQVNALIGRISILRLEVESMHGIFKFSQEKALADRVGAQAGLLRKLRAGQHRALPRLAGLETDHDDAEETPIAGRSHD